MSKYIDTKYDAEQDRLVDVTDRSKKFVVYASWNDESLYFVREEGRFPAPKQASGVSRHSTEKEADEAAWNYRQEAIAEEEEEEETEERKRISSIYFFTGRQDEDVQEFRKKAFDALKAGAFVEVLDGDLMYWQASNQYFLVDRETDEISEKTEEEVKKLLKI
jgi:hypothetical protein